MPTEKIHVIYLYADQQNEWNCSHWRCHLLSNAINYQNDKNPDRFPHTAQMLEMQSAASIHHPQVQKVMGFADIIVFQRNVLWEPIWNMMDYWRALGKIVLVDLDDHYPEIPPSNPAFGSWIMNNNEMEPHPIEALKEGLRHADGLIAPSEVLLKDWEHIVPIYYWANYPSLLDWENVIRRQLGARDFLFVPEISEENPKEQVLMAKEIPDSAGKIVIGWGGSLSHIDSFKYSGVIEGMKMLLEENKNVVFKFCGNEDRIQFLLNDLPQEQVWRQPGVSSGDWPQVVSTFDIGIAPLDMRPVPSGTGNEHGIYSYDERRSWLKCVEYACGGIPFVASNSATYNEFKRYGKMVENTPEAWYEALKSRVDGITHFREEAYKRKKNNLKRFTIENNAQKLIDFYLDIGERTQAKQNLLFPNILAIPENEDAEWEPLETARYSGDPLAVGYASHGPQTKEIARTWWKDLGLFDESYELGDIVTYPILSMLNIQVGGQPDDS
ncbi:MAG: hypothetical protein ACW99J_15520 [Candidatus Thorarchaeota archaeon]|jgi:hypothetical protein